MGGDRREVSWLPSLPRHAFPVPRWTSGYRIDVRRAVARSQWRARAGLSPASLSTDPWAIWRQRSASLTDVFAYRPLSGYCLVGHAFEGTRWESGTDAQRYGQ